MQVLRKSAELQKKSSGSFSQNQVHLTLKSGIHRNVSVIYVSQVGNLKIDMHSFFIHSATIEYLFVCLFMFQALFCILGDKSEQNKAPFSNGIVRWETEQNTSKHV